MFLILEQVQLLVFKGDKIDLTVYQYPSSTTIVLENDSLISWYNCYKWESLVYFKSNNHLSFFLNFIFQSVIHLLWIFTIILFVLQQVI